MKDPIKENLNQLARDTRNATIDACLEVLECSHDLTEAKRLIRQLKAKPDAMTLQRGMNT